LRIFCQPLEGVKLKGEGRALVYEGESPKRNPVLERRSQEKSEKKHPRTPESWLPMGSIGNRLFRLRLSEEGKIGKGGRSVRFRREGEICMLKDKVDFVLACVKKKISPCPIRQKMKVTPGKKKGRNIELGFVKKLELFES